MKQVLPFKGHLKFKYSSDSIYLPNMGIGWEATMLTQKQYESKGEVKKDLIISLLLFFFTLTLIVILL